jgi:hypothetical protein
VIFKVLRQFFRELTITTRAASRCISSANKNSPSAAANGSLPALYASHSVFKLRRFRGSRF